MRTSTPDIATTRACEPPSCTRSVVKDENAASRPFNTGIGIVHWAFVLGTAANLGNGVLILPGLMSQAFGELLLLSKGTKTSGQLLLQPAC
jgi:hypothetical protein